MLLESSLCCQKSSEQQENFLIELSDAHWQPTSIGELVFIYKWRSFFGSIAIYFLIFISPLPS